MLSPFRKFFTISTPHSWTSGKLRFVDDNVYMRKMYRAVSVLKIKAPNLGIQILALDVVSYRCQHFVCAFRVRASLSFGGIWADQLQYTAHKINVTCTVLNVYNALLKV